ncbi:MAG: serine/threonine protein kinase, partial [Halioglobus sp.]|nr:serine/threonine protein kinase [Halioglobus sp.]
NGRMLALNSYENRVYQVGIEGGAPVVAKFYRPGRWSDDAIEEEHEFAAELAGAEIPVVAPLCINGATLHRHGPFRVSVSPCHGGRAPELDNDDLLRQIGRLVARIHLQGERSTFRARPRVDIDSYGSDSVDYLLDHRFIPQELEGVYLGIAEHLLDNIEAAFDRAGSVQELRLHADFHPGNVLVQEDRVHIVDLDDARSGPAVQDLWMFLSGDRDEQTPQLATLLEGYQEFRQFNARELHLVEALRSLRMMHYAAWLARRWADPAFKQAFPWFNSRRYWDEQILTLREQTALVQESPLAWYA